MTTPKSTKQTTTKTDRVFNLADKIKLVLILLAIACIPGLVLSALSSVGGN